MNKLFGNIIITSQKTVKPKPYKYVFHSKNVYRVPFNFHRKSKRHSKFNISRKTTKAQEKCHANNLLMDQRMRNENPNYQTSEA